MSIGGKRSLNMEHTLESVIDPTLNVFRTHALPRGQSMTDDAMTGRLPDNSSFVEEI